MENGKLKADHPHFVRAASSLALLLIMLFPSCGRNDDPFIGRWVVEKVHVEFNENGSTPEMVRQLGEMEKGNVIEISSDSVLCLISDGDTLKGLCSLHGTQLTFGGKPFGTLERGRIRTETDTPLGKVGVCYKKDY